jgi:DNA polymerase III epsilon subunit-like protein
MAVYILFDTETTGNGDSDRIIQVGAMIIHSKDNIEVIDEMCSCDEPIKIEAMEVHNITPEQLEGKPTYSQTSFASKIEEYNQPQNYLIAHNINFDLGMLQKEGFENRYTLIDTLRCAKHLLANSPYHRLQYLRYSLGLYKIENQEAQKLGVEIKAHDAIGDVLVMKLLISELIKIIQEEYKGINPMEKLAQLTQTPVLMREFKFGKYKGEAIDEIASSDMGYLKWMRNNLELDEDMKYTLDFYLG